MTKRFEVAVVLISDNMKTGLLRNTFSWQVKLHILTQNGTVETAYQGETVTQRKDGPVFEAPAEIIKEAKHLQSRLISEGWQESHEPEWPLRSLCFYRSSDSQGSSTPAELLRLLHQAELNSAIEDTVLDAFTKILRHLVSSQASDVALSTAWVDELTKLADLCDRKLLTQTEYDKAKKKLLGG